MWKGYLILILFFTQHLIAQAPFGEALYLNGDYQHIEIPAVEVLEYDLERNLAIEFWIKPNSYGKFNLINKWHWCSMKIDGWEPAIPLI
jgi:hypothetical protein